MQMGDEGETGISKVGGAAGRCCVNIYQQCLSHSMRISAETILNRPELLGPRPSESTVTIFKLDD